MTKIIHRNAKSLVKHLLVADLTKRYGNLKGGKSKKIFSQALVILKPIDGSQK